MPVQKNHSEDSLFLNDDYSLDDYISMRRTDFDHGFPDYQGKGPKGWQRSDERIREDVSLALLNNPYVDASEIEVHVKDGVVTLSGHVENREMKKEAEFCIEDVVGIDDVRNELHIIRY